MNFALCLALLAFISFTNAEILGNSSNFLLGSWFGNATIPLNVTGHMCCVPTNDINLWTDGTNTSQTFFTASSWEGDACSLLNIFPNYTLRFPFPGANSYNQIKDKASYNEDDIGFIVTNGKFDQKDEDGNQVVFFDIQFDYLGLIGGENCTVTLSKSGKILSTISAVLVAIIAFFAF